MNWPPAEVDIVHQNRYAVDWSEMRDYHRNYLMAVDQKMFNLKNHSKYLDIILAKPGIMQDVVFRVEKGRVYFADRHKVPTDLYDQGVLTPLPASPGSKWFLDREVVAVVYVMVIVACPSGQNIADNNPNGFGRMCLMGLLNVLPHFLHQWRGDAAESFLEWLMIQQLNIVFRDVCTSYFMRFQREDVLVFK